jgi:hypothetical protein
MFKQVRDLRSYEASKLFTVVIISQALWKAEIISKCSKQVVWQVYSDKLRDLLENESHSIIFLMYIFSLSCTECHTVFHHVM